MKTEKEKIARQQIRRTRWWKSEQSFLAGFQLLLLGAFLVLVNVVVFVILPQYPQQFRLRDEWSALNLSELSGLSEQVLGGLQEPVRVWVFTRDRGESHAAGLLLRDLLTEYAARSPLVTVEHVDPNRDLGRASELQTRFQLTEADQVILESGGHHEIIAMDEMVVREPDETRPLGEAPRMIGFRGETLLTGALIRLAGGEPPVVYFLTGHGQKDIDDFEDSARAYSNVRERLETANMRVKKLHLEETRDGRVPEDASLVVIAGPTLRLPQPDIDALRVYLSEGGRLFVLLNATLDAGLGPMLAEWGVQLVDDVVIDPAATHTGAEVYVARFADHPVTRNLRGVTVPFLRPRSVRPLAGDTERTPADRPRFTALAATTARGYAKQDLTDPDLTMRPGVDAPGPIPLAAAIERVVPGGQASRLVVVGDADFVANWSRAGGGLRFFQNAVAWLIDREQGAAIPPREVEEVRLLLDRAELRNLFFIVVLGMPGAVGVFGFLVAMRRRA